MMTNLGETVGSGCASIVSGFFCSFVIVAMAHSLSSSAVADEFRHSESPFNWTIGVSTIGEHTSDHELLKEFQVEALLAKRRIENKELNVNCQLNFRKSVDVNPKSSSKGEYSEQIGIYCLHNGISVSVLPVICNYDAKNPTFQIDSQRITFKKSPYIEFSLTPSCVVKPELFGMRKDKP